MTGYVYRGNEPWTGPRPRYAKPEAPARDDLPPFDPTACGSMRGYRQHRIHNQEQCRDCMNAQNEYQNALRAKRKE